MAIISHAFGGRWKGLLVVLQVFTLSEGGHHRIAKAQPTVQMDDATDSKLFSEQWVEDFSGHNLGCEIGRVSYMWRSAGFGSNINNLLNAWEYTLAVEGWSDLAVVFDDAQLPELDCSHESGGLASRGWSCIFSHMPHLCTFDTPELWERHLKLTGISADDAKEADRIEESLGAIRNKNFEVSFEALDVDHRGARAVMSKFLWGHRTPWLRRDVNVVTGVRKIFETSPFIAIHIRRGDRIVGQDVRLKHDVKDYLAEAVRYLEQESDGTSVSDIKGIWVASDASDVVNEVRALAGAYFPGVLGEDIVYVDDGVAGGVQTSEMTTRSEYQGYGSLVYLMADLEQLAAADVFVGTCSSNLGRLVTVLRDGLGKTNDTSISLDIPWYPKRQRSLGLD